jgi:methylmalonyl-CoA mutase N-terminal domain/subunit
VRERFSAQDDRSCMFRFGVVSGGASLHAPQPHNNIVRVAYEAMASVLGGVQSMFTAAWDEPFAIPTEESATLALRTQQILAEETGVARVADPLGGSYYVEALTDAMEARVVEIMDDLERQGGMVRCIEDGVLQRMISEQAFGVEQAVRSGERTVVGVNKFESDEPPPDVEGYELDEKGRIRQLERLADVKRSRSAADVKATLGALSAAAASSGENLMPLLVDCAKAYCTVGEMVGVLKDQWGEFQQPVVF